MVRVLTTREREVLSCRERGLSNKQAAAELGIALGTVKNHVAKILRKLQAGNCHEAIWQLKQGTPQTSAVGAELGPKAPLAGAR